MENLEIYSRMAHCPKNAQKRIEGGNLKGKTDINPMWRLKMLTEIFGPAGFGFVTKVTDRWTSEGEGECVAWVQIELTVKHPETGEWSQPIVGIGGSKLYGKGKGTGINDEAYKMAETDAISVACKKLGMAADIYWEQDSTKYTSAPQVQAPAQAPQKPQIVEGNERWDAAITYCRNNGKRASELRRWYTLDEKTEQTINNILDYGKGSGDQK